METFWYGEKSQSDCVAVCCLLYKKPHIDKCDKAAWNKPLCKLITTAGSHDLIFFNLKRYDIVLNAWKYGNLNGHTTVVTD